MASQIGKRREWAEEEEKNDKKNQQCPLSFLEFSITLVIGKCQVILNLHFIFTTRVSSFE